MPMMTGGGRCRPELDARSVLRIETTAAAEGPAWFQPPPVPA